MSGSSGNDEKKAEKKTFKASKSEKGQDETGTENQAPGTVDVADRGDTTEQDTSSDPSPPDHESLPLLQGDEHGSEEQSGPILSPSPDDSIPDEPPQVLERPAEVLNQLSETDMATNVEITKIELKERQDKILEKLQRDTDSLIAKAVQEALDAGLDTDFLSESSRSSHGINESGENNSNEVRSVAEVVNEIGVQLANLEIDPQHREDFEILGNRLRRLEERLDALTSSSGDRDDGEGHSHIETSSDQASLSTAETLVDPTPSTGEISSAGNESSEQNPTDTSPEPVVPVPNQASPIDIPSTQAATNQTSVVPDDAHNVDKRTGS